MATYRYSRWDGSQDVFPLHEEEVMDQLSDQLMAQGDVSSALRSLLQRGARGKFGQHLSGVQDLLQKLRSLRQETLGRYDLDSAMEHIKQQLQDVIETERRGIQRRLDEIRTRLQESHANDHGVSQETGEELLRLMETHASRSQVFLDQLPEDTAKRLKQLSDYEFMDPEAKSKFDEIMSALRQQVLDSLLKEFSQHLQGLDPKHNSALRELLRDLNGMLERGVGAEEHTEFDRFMLKYRQLFGPNPPASLNELIELMRRRTAQMQSLLRSMTPQQHQELRDALDAVFQDEELVQELRRLDANLEALDPLGSVSREYSFRGDDPLTLEEGLGLIERLQNIEEAEAQLRRTNQGANLSEVDGQLLKDLLEEAGYIRKVGNRYELTPKGMRKIGQSALKEIFTFIKKDRTGFHANRSHGFGGDRLEEATKRYEFGDPFDPHLSRTIMNAVQRGEGVPLRLHQDDFEVYRTEQASQAATVLMVDLSLSMAMRGNFLAAKKVALALDNLIRSQFPRDALYIVGFSTYAREVKPDKLPYLNWDEFDPYTNIQHGLELSQRLLSRLSGGTKQIILISDGEPTAHLEAGQLFLQYPPSSRTIRETLREVTRCTRLGITINTFMLDRNSYLVQFVDKMTRINRGRVFYTSADRLGQYILVDYLTKCRRLMS